jgi:hypothetical protein
MASPITFASNKSVICHGAGAVHLVDYEPGTKIWTGQPNTEDFDDPIEAIKRACELGLSPGETTTFWPEGKFYDPAGKRFVDAPADVPIWEPDGDYPQDAVVRHQGQTWLHISGKQGAPDEVYDIDAGTGDWIPVTLP